MYLPGKLLVSQFGPAVVSGQLLSVLIQPVDPEHVGVRLAAACVVVGEEDAGEEEVPSRPELRDRWTRADAQQRQVDVGDRLLALQTHVRTRVSHGKVAEDEGAVGRDCGSAGFVRVAVDPASSHLLAVTDQAASEEGPGDGGAAGWDRSGAGQQGGVSDSAVNKHRVLHTPHTWRQNGKQRYARSFSS